MNIHKPRPFDPRGGTETPEAVFHSRRRWLKTAAAATGVGIAGAAGWLGWRWFQGDDEDVVTRGEVVFPGNSLVPRSFPARRDERFSYDRPETERAAAARYTNFYEFSSYKWTWRFVDDFQPYPWTLAVSGLCRNPLRLDLDEFHRTFAREFVERQYRHRCVERWAMAVPWTGIPLAALLRAADPFENATHVRFISFERPEQAANQRGHRGFPWPYEEGLTLPEAMNDLTLLATGVYGHPLLKQHGAPLRLVVPWKYGYKSIKSIMRIELTDHQPATFWSTLNPAAYPFESNVDPDVPRPWPQTGEQMLGSDERYSTQWLNGYAEHVAQLYRRKP